MFHGKKPLTFTSISLAVELIQYFVTDFTYLIRYPSLPDDCSQIFIRPLNRLLQEGKPVLPDAPLSGVLLANFFTNVPINLLAQ